MTLLNRLAAASLISGGLMLPAQAYDLQYRQNGTTFTAPQLREIFNGSLPAQYDQRFADQRWTTYLLLDAHANKNLVAITLGLSPRVGPSQALLPVATFSVIEPLPRTPAQWRQLLGGVASQYARLMLDNRSRILNQH
ncbi:hypothetical protein KBY76_01650 [Synechococcus sp. GreenBA-s]|nr:hypothetical protein [Synechococcus sp. GreenBA-s]